MAGCCGCGGTIPPGTQELPPTGAGPLIIMGASSVVAGWDAADLIASPVAAWPDHSGNGFTLVQAVAGSRPVWGATAGPNNQPAVLFDGVDDAVINALLTRPLASVAPTFLWAILRQVTWTLNRRFWGFEGGATRFALIQNPGTPTIVQANNVAVNANGGLPLGTYKRVEAFFNAALTDYNKSGSTSVTGASAGDSLSTPGFHLGSAGDGTLFSNVQVCELWIFNVLPSADKVASLDAYASARYGAGVVA